MRWLQWSTIDLENGSGGVEVHARSLARELRALGHEVMISRDPEVLRSSQWDVVHTHGSAVPLKRIALKRRGGKPVRVHTLHGTTLGRMAACGEWTWPGGYLAALREYRAVLDSDVILTVKLDLSLVRFARKLEKEVTECGNGWDAGSAAESLPESLVRRFPEKGKFWVFVGRGDDPVKAVGRLVQAAKLLPDLRLVAVPGSGFSSSKEIESHFIQTGPLSSAQLLELYDRAAGLILCSKYEGNSLVMLEALARGLPVISTPVGGAPMFQGKVDGLFTTDSGDPRALADAYRAASRVALDERSRELRREHNRRVLPTWRRVAESSVGAVEAFRKAGHV